MAYLLLVLQLLIGLPKEKDPFSLDATIAYSARLMDDGMEIAVTYPSGGKLVRACSVFYEPPDLESGINEPGAEIARHCWTPTNEVADFDVWAREYYYGHEYLVCLVEYVLPNGEKRVQYAHPVVGRDS